MSNHFTESKSLRVVLGLILVLGIYFILVTALIYVEKDSYQSPIKDYSNAIWYAVVTLTTVGYGDVVPATVYGRVIGFIFILTSLGIYGILIGQITNLMATIKERKQMGYSGTVFEHHAVIIGWNDFGKLVIDQLVGVGRQVAVITNNKAHIAVIKEQYNSKNVFTLFADFGSFDLLKKANIEKATVVFINLEDDTEKLVYILNMKKFYPNTEFVVTLDKGDLRNTFTSAGVTNTISKHEISSKLLASYMFEPDVAAYFESIMSFAKGDGDYDLKQFLITSSNPYAGKSYQEVFFELKQKYNSVLIGITKRDEFGVKKLIKNPVDDLTLSAGDYLLIILNGKAFKLLRKIFAVDEGYIREQP